MTGPAPLAPLHAGALRPPHALRAVVRCGLVDLALLAAAQPFWQCPHTAQLLAFLAGVAWPLPPDRIVPVLRRLGRRRQACARYATCAVAEAPMAEPQWRLIGTIEQIVGSP